MMREIILLAIALTTGCIFGGEEPKEAADSGVSELEDMIVADGGGRDAASPGDTGQPPVDVGAPDAASPPDMSPPPNDAGPNGWHLPAYAKRVLVSWNRSGMAVQNLVVPVDIPGPDGANLNAAAVWTTGAELATERDGRTLWVRVPDFGRNGEMWIYFDGPESTQSLDEVWGDYEGVWHFSGTVSGRDSSGKGNTMAGVMSGLQGFIGPSAQMPSGGGQSNQLTAPLSFAGQRSYTVEMWVTLGASPQNNLNNKIFDAFEDGEQKVALRWANGRAVNMVVGTATTSLNDFADYPEMTTHLAVVVDDAQSTVQLYVNGVPDARLDTPAGWTPSDQVTAFGSAWYGGGSIDEVRVSFGAQPAEYFAAVVGAYRRGDLGVLRYSEVEQQ